MVNVNHGSLAAFKLMFGPFVFLLNEVLNVFDFFNYVFELRLSS